MRNRGDNRIGKLALCIAIAALSSVAVGHLPARADVPRCFDASTTDLSFDVAVTSSGNERVSLSDISDLRACATVDGAVERNVSLETFDGCGSPCFRVQVEFTGDGSVALELLFRSMGEERSMGLGEEPVTAGRTVAFCFSSGNPRPGCPVAGQSVEPEPSESPGGEPSQPPATQPSPGPSPAESPSSGEPPSGGEPSGESYPGGEPPESAGSGPAAARSLIVSGTRTRHRIKLRGWISAAETCAPWQRVELNRRRGPGRWIRVGVRSTDAEGAFRFALKWRPASTYRVVAVATEGCATAASDRIRL